MTTPNMLLVLPTPGASSGTWDDLLNAAMTLVDGHDHTNGKGPLVPTTGLNINADLTMASHSLTNVASADFSETTVASGARRLFFSSSDHELYVRTASGTNVKVTNGAGLNLSLSGGIVGDYASIGAEVAYNDANDRYTFKQQVGSGAVKQWARLSSGDVDLYEVLATNSATTIANRVRLQSPATLAASYALTFPAALPVSTQLAQVSSAGVITASNTVTNAITLSGGISGNTALTGSLTLDAGSNVTIQGSGDYKFGTRRRHFSTPSYFATASWNGPGGYVTSSGAGTVAWCIPVSPGYSLASLTLDVYGASSGACGINLVCESDSSGGVTVQTDTHTPTNGAWTTRSFNFADYNITTGGGECISIYVTLAATGMLCRRLIITESNP